jgi:hypothetical protein
MIAGAVSLLAACETTPASYPVPEQSRLPENARPHQLSKMIDMAYGDSAEHFVKDIAPGEPATWRWAYKNPTVKIRLLTNENLRYAIDFSLPNATFKDTGPVTVTFSVNDHALDRIRYDHAGEYHYEKRVPSEWIRVGGDTLVAAEVDKTWIAPRDHKELGLILTRIGLTQ